MTTAAERFGVKVGDVWDVGGFVETKNARVLRLCADNKIALLIQDESIPMWTYKDHLNILISRNGKPVPQPGEWCTGQQWVEMGGNEKVFRKRWEALHDDGEVAQILGMDSLWTHWHTEGTEREPSCDDELKVYRLRLTDTQDLPPVPEPEEKSLSEPERIDYYYDNNKGTLAPRCPHGYDVAVGSAACGECSHHQYSSGGVDKGHILCSYKAGTQEPEDDDEKKHNPKIVRKEIVGWDASTGRPVIDYGDGPVDALDIHGYVYENPRTRFIDARPMNFMLWNTIRREWVFEPTTGEIINGEVIRVLPVAVLVEE